MSLDQPDDLDLDQHADQHADQPLDQPDAAPVEQEQEQDDGRDPETGQFTSSTPLKPILAVFYQQDDLAEPMSAGEVHDRLPDDHDLSRRSVSTKLHDLADEGHLKTKKVSYGRVFYLSDDRITTHLNDDGLHIIPDPDDSGGLFG